MCSMPVGLGAKRVRIMAISWAKLPFYGLERADTGRWRQISIRWKLDQIESKTCGYEVNAIIPADLRPRSGKWIGTTAFFRNRVLLDALLADIARSEPERFEVLVHACSNGAEIYTFLIAWHLHPFLYRVPVTVSACDIAAEFLEMAGRAVYPSAILAEMTERERAFFLTDNANEVVVSKQLRDRVRFEAPSSFASFAPDRSWDLVILNNALIYVDAEAQSQTIARIATYNRRWLVTSGFHMATIAADLTRNCYVPILDRIEEIHAGWHYRVNPNLPEPRPDWALPPFSRIPDYEYRYCALFERKRN